MFVLAAGIAGCYAGVGPAPPPPPGLNAGAPMPVGDCKMDAVKMCTEIDTSGKAATATPTGGAMYGSTTTPDAVDFDIPAGVQVRLMCYFDPQHTTVTRADATPKSELDAGSIAYLKGKNFCQ